MSDATKIIALAWNSEDYKAMLLSNPRAALAEAGVESPEGAELKVLENTSDVQYVVMPVAPSEALELLNEELENVTGDLLHPAIAKVIARAWVSPDYKAKLLSNPHAALAEAGVKAAPGAVIRVVENTAETRHVVLPVAPRGAHEAPVDALEKVASGLFYPCGLPF